KKSIAGFKLREGMPIGCKVTLRRDRMYEFLDRLVTIALPRVRDFRGLPGKSFDGRGNYALGLKEQLVFPEIEYDQVEQVRGMDIVICTTAKTDAEAKALLAGLNLPFNSSDIRRTEDVAKTSAIDRHKNRTRMTKQHVEGPAALKAIIQDKSAPPEERFAAQLKLAELPRNSSPVRIRNRCDLSGRPRGYYRKFRLSRIALRELASEGQIPGMVKSSW